MITDSTIKNEEGMPMFEFSIHNQRSNLGHDIKFVYERSQCKEMDNDENTVFIKVEEGQPFRENAHSTFYNESLSTKHEKKTSDASIKKQKLETLTRMFMVLLSNSVWLFSQIMNRQIRPTYTLKFKLRIRSF
jgi:hypothetical protein